MAITLTIRKRCVRPLGTEERDMSAAAWGRRMARWGTRTVPVVVEVGELVTPLGYYSKRIFEESDDNQEASNCGQIAVGRHVSGGIQDRTRAARALRGERDSRLDGVGERVQPVLDLASLFPQLLERTGVVGGAVTATSAPEGALVAQVVARGTAYLRHDGGRRKERKERERSRERSWVGGPGF